MTCICGATLEPEEILSDTSDNPRVLGVHQPTLCEQCSDRYEEAIENADNPVHEMMIGEEFGR